MSSGIQKSHYIFLMDSRIEPALENRQEKLSGRQVEPAPESHGEQSPVTRKNNPLLDSSDVLSAVKFLCVLGVAVAICALSLQNPGDFLRSRQQFSAWYNQYSYQFLIIAKDNCTDAYSTYLYGTRQNTTNPTLSGAGDFTLFIQPMIDCLLDNASEYIKYQLATSQVVLGITPTIICLLGATSEEVCLLALVGKRRLLGLLLSAASPSIYTERAFKYQDADEILKDLHHNHVKSTVIAQPRGLFVVLEYLAVLGAIANVGALNWELGTRSINTLSANTIYMPLIWSVFGILAHLMGAAVFDMRARKLDEATMEPEPRPTFRSVFGLNSQDHEPKTPSTNKNLVDVVYTELFWLPEDKIDHSTTKPLRSSRGNKRPEKRIRFTLLADSRMFTFLAWLFSVIVIFHVIIGTLVLSSTNFVGPKDALVIMVRYILSVIVCRIILVYELAVLGMEYRPQN